nr:BTB/POZ domain-containing protein DOT3-like [Crassostrea gigas]
MHFTVSNSNLPLKSTKEVGTSCEGLEQFRNKETQHQETEEKEEEEEQTAEQMEIDIDGVILERMIHRQEELKEDKEEIERRLTDLQSRVDNIEQELEDIMYLMD